MKKERRCDRGRAVENPGWVLEHNREAQKIEVRTPSPLIKKNQEVSKEWGEPRLKSAEEKQVHRSWGKEKARGLRERQELETGARPPRGAR